MKTRLITLLLCFITFLASAQEPGTPDDNFNKTGFKIFDVMPNVSGTSNAVTTQPDGKVLICGATNMFIDRKAYLVRLLPNGDFDSTFHFDGKVTIDMSNEDWDAFYDAVVLPDGKILALGETMEGGDFDILLARFYPDGSLDANFGNLGIAKYDIDPNTADRPRQLRILNNGKFLVMVNPYGVNQNQTARLLRFNENGSIDKSFGKNGSFIYDENHSVYFRELAVLPDNKIILGVQTEDNDGPRLALMGLTEDGETDVSFGSGGTASHALTPSQSDLIIDLELTPDKKNILVAGRTEGSTFDIFMAKFSLTGGLDVQFGNGGYQTIDLSIGGDDYVMSSAIQPDGKILITGATENELYVARFHSDGILDYSFNTTGYWSYDLNPGAVETPREIVYDQQGRAIIVGYIYKDNTFISYAVAINTGNISTGINDEIKKIESLDISPNPSHGIFNIEMAPISGSSQYLVLDMVGKVISSGTLPKSSQAGTFSINATNWPNGQYIIQIEDGQQHIWSGKIIKQ